MSLIEVGRYGAFVWPAYLITGGAFAWMIIDTLVRARAWRRKVETLEKAREPDGQP
jgi:heme exporter protein D